MVNAPLFLGIDLGTSSLKCGLFDLSGRRAGAARVPYPTREWGGGAEQQAGDWWEALAIAVHHATANAEGDRGRIAAIGVGGHAPSPVFVDPDLEPVWPVLPWFDGRSAAHRDRLLRALGRPPADGGERLMTQVAARAVWLRGAAPVAFARAACFLHSGDYLIARLTGRRIATSPRVPEILDAAGLPPSLFPEEECRPGERVGVLLPAIATAWGLGPAVPVVAGGLDSFLATVGSGLRGPGDSCLSTGSSTVVAAVARPGCAGRFEWAGCQILSRPIRPGGRLLQWARRFAGPEDAIGDLLREASRSRWPTGALDRFAGFLRGAGGEDCEVRDQVSEIAQRCPPPELFYLLLVAIFLGQRAALEGLERQGGPLRRPRSVGGLAADPALDQLQADVLGRAVEVPRITESGALGAAMLAATAIGACTPGEAATRMVRPGRTHAPRDEAAATFDRLFAGIHAATAVVAG
jgi:sugar (pentulose or hexulose) kinase